MNEPHGLAGGLVAAMRALQEDYDLDVVSCSRQVPEDGPQVVVRVVRNGMLEVEGEDGWLLARELP